MATTLPLPSTSKPQPLIAKDHFKAFYRSIQRLEEEKKAIADDIRDVYAGGEGRRFRRQGAAQDRADAQAGQDERPSRNDPADLVVALGML